MTELVCVLSKDVSENGLVKTSNKQKTQKKKINRSNDDKSKLWDIYDNDRTDINKKKTDIIECVYAKDSEVCNICQAPLMIMENGFPTCTGTTCGVIYKDALDYSPEWRFYGSEDKNAKDPT